MLRKLNNVETSAILKLPKKTIATFSDINFNYMEPHDLNKNLKLLCNEDIEIYFLSFWILSLIQIDIILCTKMDHNKLFNQFYVTI